jgi:hypothetical protein
LVNLNQIDMNNYYNCNNCDLLIYFYYEYNFYDIHFNFLIYYFFLNYLRGNLFLYFYCHVLMIYYLDTFLINYKKFN